jgi:hypothetical protein
MTIWYSRARMKQSKNTRCYRRAVLSDTTSSIAPLRVCHARGR